MQAPQSPAARQCSRAAAPPAWNGSRRPPRFLKGAFRCRVGELLGIAIVAGVAGELIKGVVGVGVRQLAVGLAGQHLLHHGTVLVVGIGDLVLPVGHGGELVALVVAHGKGNHASRSRYAGA